MSDSHNEAPIYYGAERWAKAMLLLVNCEHDPRTVADWSQALGAGRATLSSWCAATHVSLRRSLELGRLLRALRLTDGKVNELHAVMDIVEPRTLTRLLRRAGFAQADGTSTLALGEALRSQQLVTDPHAVDALRRLIAHRSITETGLRRDVSLIKARS